MKGEFYTKCDFNHKLSQSFGFCIRVLRLLYLYLFFMLFNRYIILQSLAQFSSFRFLLALLLIVSSDILGLCSIHTSPASLVQLHSLSNHTSQHALLLVVAQSLFHHTISSLVFVFPGSFCFFMHSLKLFLYESIAASLVFFVLFCSN